MKRSKTKYSDLLDNIGQAIETARQNAVKAVNTELVKANWEIGRHIVEFEQHGHERAEYGSDLLARLSKDLKLRYGKGFGRRNVLDMRRFYLAYPKWQALPAKLSWTHFVALLGVSDETARKFYAKQASHENWSSRELERQIDSSLFERLALSPGQKRCFTTLGKRTHHQPSDRGRQRRSIGRVCNRRYFKQNIRFKISIVFTGQKIITKTSKINYGKGIGRLPLVVSPRYVTSAKNQAN